MPNIVFKRVARKIGRIAWVATEPCGKRRLSKIRDCEKGVQNNAKIRARLKVAWGNGRRSSVGECGQALERYRRCLTGPPGRRRPPYLPLFLPLHGQHALPALLAAAAQAALGVDPLEALGQYVANVGQVQQEQRHAHDRVQYGRQFAAQRPRRHVTVTCETVREKKFRSLAHEV